MTALPPDLVARLLGPDAGHVPVPLQRLPDARLLWLNRRAMHDDPQFARCGGDEARYANHLLEACAWRTAAPGGDVDTLGYADRYGGERIGFNGGSGRTVTVGGYCVKGVGRTPLVSALTDEGHASGGAYLEETVRETIYGEIVATEFPHAGVPTLAIIDTGLVQDWHTTEEPQSERRTLLVRPSFVRPAHFQRAAGFQSGHAKEGSSDAHRVRQVFGIAVEALGADGLMQHVDQLWDRWAEQMAHAFVHRLPHGADNTSNIAIDGRLLDFGGTNVVPSWAAAATSFFPQRFSQRFGVLVHCIRSMGYFFGRHLHAEIGSEAAIKRRIDRAWAVHSRAVTTQVLRVCGAPAATARDAVAADRPGHLWRQAVRLIEHYQRETLDMVVATPVPVIPWDVDRLWDDTPPAHLRAMRGVLQDLVGEAGRDDARRRNAILASDRPLLHKREMRTAIYRALDVDRSLGPQEDARRTAELIGRIVSQSGRAVATEAIQPGRTRRPRPVQGKCRRPCPGTAGSTGRR